MMEKGTKVFFYPGLIDRVLYPMLAGTDLLTGTLVYDQTPGTFSVVTIEDPKNHMNNKEHYIDNDGVFLTEEDANNAI